MPAALKFEVRANENSIVTTTFRTATSEEAEHALKLASACITEVPVLILGSGASCAHGIRGMGGLADYLIANVKADAADRATWNSFQAELTANSDLEETLQKVDVSGDLLQQIIHHTHMMIRVDEEPIYHKVISNELSLGLSSLYRHMLRTTHQVIDVVTTNYDRLAEYAANHAGFTCNTGFNEGTIRRFDCQNSDPSLYHRKKKFRCVDIWKVHGSVDWFHDGDMVPLALLDSVSNLERFKSLIVTPGTGKYLATSQEPFRSVMTCADSALSGARAFLCVGYGFSDIHIEPKLIQRTRDNRPPTLILARTLRDGAKAFLQNHMSSNVIAFERSKNGTIAYFKSAATGVQIDGEDLWSLEGLLQKLGIMQ